MQAVTTIGLDIAKSVFQVHGIDAEDNVIIRRQLKRHYVLTFFQKVPPCLVGIEACASSHYWSRELKALGHTVRLMPPAYVKPYVKRAIDAKGHAFDRDRGDKIPASWLKSHGRSLVRYHLHPESKFWGGDYDQRGPLRRRHVFALTHVSIGKESDQIEENECIGEDAGPVEHPLAGKDRSELGAFIFEAQKQRKISNRTLCGWAGVSAHTLSNLRKSVQISDKSLFRLVRAAEQLRHETEPVAAVSARWLQKARELLSLVGSQNKLANVLGVSRPYLGRVLRGKKPMTARMIERIRVNCV